MAHFMAPGPGRTGTRPTGLAMRRLNQYASSSAPCFIWVSHIHIHTQMSIYSHRVYTLHPIESILTVYSLSDLHDWCTPSRKALLLCFRIDPGRPNRTNISPTPTSIYPGLKAHWHNCPKEAPPQNTLWPWKGMRYRLCLCGAVAPCAELPSSQMHI